MRYKAMAVGGMSGDAGVRSECEVKTQMTPDHIAFHVRSCG